MSEPCFRCGAAGPCRHRPDAPEIRLPEPKKDGRSRPDSGQGWNFHRPSVKHVQSLFGKAGNPTKKQFEKMIRK